MKPRTLEVARAAKLNTKLALKEMSLFEVRARRLPPHGVPEQPSFTFAMAFSPTLYADYEGELLPVYTLNVFIQHHGEGERVPLAELNVAMRAAYTKNPDFLPGDLDFADDYLGIVGWMHAWPYVRAEIQSLSTKLGFPALVLPTLLAGQTADTPIRRIDPKPEDTALLETSTTKAPKKRARKTAKAR